MKTNEPLASTRLSTRLRPSAAPSPSSSATSASATSASASAECSSSAADTSSSMLHSAASDERRLISAPTVAAPSRCIALYASRASWCIVSTSARRSSSVVRRSETAIQTRRSQVCCSAGLAIANRSIRIRQICRAVGRRPTLMQIAQNTDAPVG
eukprot:6770388-Prymnesium_polylepis.1